ncbi:MAG: tetratricopeptide repeat protein, partial [Acidobacteriota bacterium]
QEKPFYLKRQADSLISLKRYPEAFALLKQLDDRDTNPFILSSLARCHEGLGQNEEARRCYQALLRIRPGDDFASSRLLQLKVEEKRPEEAEQELDRMLRVPSRRDDPALLKVKAEQMKKRGDFAAAADIYSRLAEGCDSGQRLFYQRMSAFALNKAGRSEEAWAAFRKLIDKDPGDHYVRSALISAARKLGRDAELAEFFESLARQSPANRPLFGVARKIRQRIKE